MYDAPITYDDNWFIGEDKRIRFAVYVDGHGPDDPDPQRQDITGWTIQWVVKVRPSALASVIEKEADHLDDATGLVEVVIDRADTVAGIVPPVSGGLADDIQPGNYVHSLVRTDSGFYSELVFGSAVLRLGAA